SAHHRSDRSAEAPAAWTLAPRSLLIHHVHGVFVQPTFKLAQRVQLQPAPSHAAQLAGDVFREEVVRYADDLRRLTDPKCEPGRGEPWRSNRIVRTIHFDSVKTLVRPVELA